MHKHFHCPQRRRRTTAKPPTPSGRADGGGMASSTTSRTTASLSSSPAPSSSSSFVSVTAIITVAVVTLQLAVVLQLQPVGVQAQRPLYANATLFGIGGIGTGGLGGGYEGVATTTIRPSLRGFSTFSDGGGGVFGGAFAGGGSGFGANAQQRKLSGRQSSRNALDPPRQQFVVGGTGASPAAAATAASQHPTGVIVSQTSESSNSGGGGGYGSYGTVVGSYGGGAGGGGGGNDAGSITYGSYGSPAWNGINGGGIVGLGNIAENSEGGNGAINGGGYRGSASAGFSGTAAGTGGGMGSSGPTLSGMTGLYSQMGRGRKQTISDLRKNLPPPGRPSDEAKMPLNSMDARHMEAVLGIRCTFETRCAWVWDESVADGFKIVTGANLTSSNLTGMMPGPAADSQNNARGHFLYLRLNENTTQRELRSPDFSPTRETCHLEFAMHQSGMALNSMRVIIEPQSANTSWVLAEVVGNNFNTWELGRYRIGRVSQQFRLVIEVVPSGRMRKGDPRAHVAIDDLRIIECFPEMVNRDQACATAQVNCYRNQLEMCLRTVNVCDLDLDCDGREDEQLNCDKIPFGGRCDFEDGWCGWENSGRVIMLWERHSGPTPTEKTGPDNDHTLQGLTNGTQGHYMYVNMNQHANDEEKKRNVGFASNAVMNSVVFNPPPRVIANISSQYHNTCLVRFYVHQYGPNTGSVNLSVVEIGERENITTTLWWSSKSLGVDWQRENLIMPYITTRYFLQFEARMGMRIYSDVAIDDFSLSPECFGLNIPVEALQGYNYYEPKLFDNRPPHHDFTNKSVITLTTCGNRGSVGPRTDQCDVAYNQTDPKQKTVRVSEEAPFKGFQLWAAPNENYYTIIAKGAGGGLGSGGVGTSRGARIVTVLELHKEELLYVLVGQKGEHACIKSMGYKEKECDVDYQIRELGESKTMQVHRMFIDDGAGGGGGGTFVFVRNALHIDVPLVVAAGGGGLGIGRYLDEQEQHGRPPTGVPDDHYSGQMEGDVNVTGGYGGGWQAAPYQLPARHGGRALLEGGRGGEPCYTLRGIHGQGGFGGGGGGCMTGGGGGGYGGGDSDEKQTNGAGGTSYVSRTRSVSGLSSVAEGENSGPGSVIIVPALVTPACGCDYRCVALDEYRSEVACICPENWRLKKDNLTACEQIIKDRPSSQNYLIVFFAILSVGLVAALTGLIFMLYNRYQRKKQAAIRQKMLMEQDLQLSRLRNHPDENNLNSFNPNYGCEGLLNGRIDVRSLPLVEREKIDLLMVLGRGAFGEVYEALYRHRDGDAPMAVAVKMLPSMSTKCSEEEFIMEASIMAKFSHPNIVHLIGVCFERHPRYLVIELLAGGDLRKWLRDAREGDGLSMKDLMYCALDVAKGCRYMESRRFIHRDIAARNCLLSSKGPGRVVKIADFGMARDIYRQDYYKKGGRAMLPIKWMPPEAFRDGVFTTKTDVWSFGVLSYEIFSQGAMPYALIDNQTVMKHVRIGDRLTQPTGCPDAIYSIMRDAWCHRPEDRPTFATIIDQIVACTLNAEIMDAPMPPVQCEFGMISKNGEPVWFKYDPEECERPEVENAEDDPQDYLVPLDAQRRRMAHANAAAIAAARIGGSANNNSADAQRLNYLPNGGDMMLAMGQHQHQPMQYQQQPREYLQHQLPQPLPMTNVPQGDLLPPLTPSGGTDVPFICSDPYCTNTHHILPSSPSGAVVTSAVDPTTMRPPSGDLADHSVVSIAMTTSPSALTTSASQSGGASAPRSVETSFSVPRSSASSDDEPITSPLSPGVASTLSTFRCVSAAYDDDNERKLINLDTPQPTPTAIKPPMAFGDRDTSCNSIATITLDPAHLEQQHMPAGAGPSPVRPYINVPLQMLPPPDVLGEHHGIVSLASLAHATSNGHSRQNGDCDDGMRNDEADAVMLMDGTKGGGGELKQACRDDNTALIIGDGPAGGVKAGIAQQQQPFTIHGYSKRYKPNENHSEISC